jgi:hypothetical protein
MIAIHHTGQHTSLLFLLFITCLVIQVSSFTPVVITHTSFRNQQPTSLFTTMMSSSSSSNRIVVVGSANQDLISNSDILPAIGETLILFHLTTAHSV